MAWQFITEPSQEQKKRIAKQSKKSERGECERALYEKRKKTERNKHMNWCSTVIYVPRNRRTYFLLKHNTQETLC